MIRIWRIFTDIQRYVNLFNYFNAFALKILAVDFGYEK